MKKLNAPLCLTYIEGTKKLNNKQNRKNLIKKARIL